MRVTIESVGTEALFRSTGEGSGQTVLVDARHSEGFVPEGPRPMELMAAALGGCLADNIIVILKKKRIPFTGVRVEFEAERAPEPPKRFTAIRLRCLVQGSVIKQETLDKILDLSAKYCSAHASLTEEVPITSVAVSEPPTA